MNKPIYLKDPDPWMLAEDIPDMDFYFSQIWLSCFVNELKNPNGRAYKKVLSIYRGYHLWFYYGEQDSLSVSRHVVNKFVRTPKFPVKVNKEIVRWAEVLRDFSETIPETGLNKLSNNKLWAFFHQHDQIHTEYYQWGWIPVGSDMFHGDFTKRLKQYLKEIGVKENKINETFIILTQPTRKSLIQIERQELNRLALSIQKNKYHRELFICIFDKFQEQVVAPFGLKTHTKEYERGLEKQVGELIDQIKPAVLKQIQNHYTKYFYVNRMWVGQISTFEHFLKELVKLIGNRSNLAVTLKSEQSAFHKAVNKRQQLIKLLGIRGKWRTLFNEFGEFMVTKIYRRYSQIYALYKMDFVIKELARRLKITEKQVRFMLPIEIKKALATSKVDKQTLKSRAKFCVYYAEKNYEKIFIGNQAKALAKKAEQQVVTDSKEIQGQTGSVGKATGTVKIIIRPKDMAKMNKGDILVSIATDPDIIPAMKKAAAIVAEQGGVTSHAAIVARELGIPCLIGTKIATRVLKDGDIVEVDATKGVVKKLVPANAGIDATKGIVRKL
ncbi:MAG: PEP-utilizing enzyme [bacterium]